MNESIPWINGSIKFRPQLRLEPVLDLCHFPIYLLLLERSLRGSKGQPDRGFDLAFVDAPALIAVHDSDQGEIGDIPRFHEALDLAPGLFTRMGEGKIRLDRRVGGI